MKQAFLLALTIVHLALNGQDFNHVNFNENWQITSIDYAKFYRISGFDEKNMMYDDIVKDFFIDSDQLQMLGRYNNGIRDGEFIFYSKNGDPLFILNYNNGIRSGTWKEYYKNGRLKIEVNYIDNKEQLIQLNDSLGNSIIDKGKIDYSVLIHDTPLDIGIDFSEGEFTMRFKGEIENEYRHGKWQIYKNEKKQAIIKYDLGSIQNAYLIVDGKKYDIENNLAFPLIIEPPKLSITELFRLEPGAVIKNNYIMSELYKNSNTGKDKLVVNSKQELEEYIINNFDLRSLDQDYNLRIVISMIDKTPKVINTYPKLSNIGLNELESILKNIEEINFNYRDSIVIDYSVVETDLLY